MREIVDFLAHVGNLRWLQIPEHTPFIHRIIAFKNFEFLGFAPCDQVLLVFRVGGNILCHNGFSVWAPEEVLDSSKEAPITDANSLPLHCRRSTEIGRYLNEIVISKIFQERLRTL